MRTDPFTWHPSEEVEALILGLFVFIRNEVRDATVSSDAYLPLVGALLGKTWAEASALYWKLVSLGPPPQVLQKGFLARLVEVYPFEQDRTVNVLISAAYTLQGCNVISESLVKQGWYRISIPMSVCGMCGYLSLMFSHLDHLLDFEQRNEQAPEELGTAINHYCIVLRMAAIAHAERGTIVFEDFSIAPALPPAVRFGLQHFRDALRFVGFHEISHIDMGHHAERSSARSTCAERHIQEYEADRIALHKMHVIGPDHIWGPFLGAVMVLLSTSMMTSEDDLKPTSTHPSIVDRYRKLCVENDQLTNRADGDSEIFARPYITNVIANLFDRDRCEAWLGVDRRSALGLPADYDFDSDERFEFKSIGQLSAVDPTRSPAPRRSLLDR